MHEFLVGFSLFAMAHLFSAIWMAATMRGDLRARKEESMRLEDMLEEAKREHTDAIAQHTEAIKEMRDSFEKMARTYGERLVAVETLVGMKKDSRY